jgi:hypothetical protein
MDKREWENTWTEQNAKAEMLGGAIAFGCFGIPLIVFVLILIGVALFGME